MHSRQLLLQATSMIPLEGMQKKLPMPNAPESVSSSALSIICRMQQAHQQMKSLNEKSTYQFVVRVLGSKTQQILVLRATAAFLNPRDVKRLKGELRDPKAKLVGQNGTHQGGRCIQIQKAKSRCARSANEWTLSPPKSPFYFFLTLFFVLVLFVKFWPLYAFILSYSVVYENIRILSVTYFFLSLRSIFLFFFRCEWTDDIICVGC